MARVFRFNFLTQRREEDKMKEEYEKKAQALNELNEQQMAMLREQIIAGCIDMADVALEIEREFNALDDEVHRRIEY